ncbi:hypothetical protein [Stigmatella aurantiaca]|uniref:Uncharacterized protein n=1 Tax=Stigmatella aurantiaca (strain DW4/3-1) TaxID=378806 RepID=E3FNB8_STIAD|nr:hypothetical protein [Stigmatella aurantiaca]ADO75591.1 uncharacterized protein STAUR_7836 [Stigmatella aurantiaca DW4/3-1]
MPQSLEQHRSQGGKLPGGVCELVLFADEGTGAPAAKTRSRMSWGGSELSMEETVTAPGLAAFGGEKRLQLAALAASRVTLSLRQVVEGRTWLASLLRSPESRQGPAARRRTSRVLALHPTRLVNVLNKEC